MRRAALMSRAPVRVPRACAGGAGSRRSLSRAMARLPASGLAEVTGFFRSCANARRSARGRGPAGSSRSAPLPGTDARAAAVAERVCWTRASRESNPVGAQLRRAVCRLSRVQTEVAFWLRRRREACGGGPAEHLRIGSSGTTNANDYTVVVNAIDLCSASRLQPKSLSSSTLRAPCPRRSASGSAADRAHRALRAKRATGVELCRLSLGQGAGRSRTSDGLQRARSQKRQRCKDRFDEGRAHHSVQPRGQVPALSAQRAASFFSPRAHRAAKTASSQRSCWVTWSKARPACAPPAGNAAAGAPARTSGSSVGAAGRSLRDSRPTSPPSPQAEPRGRLTNAGCDNSAREGLTMCSPAASQISRAQWTKAELRLAAQHIPRDGAKTA